MKKIFENNVDERTHGQFTRFGKGVYEKRAVLSLHKTSKVKVKGSFEFANDFVLFVSDFVDKFSGIVLSKEKLELEGEKKKKGLYSYETEIISEKVKELKDKVYYFLLDAESPNLKLKIKKKLPKPGKGRGGKVDDKFCSLEADLKYYEKIKEAFFWDVSNCKKVKIEHTYEITSLEMPEGEKDPLKLRLKTRRRGKIIRKLNIDGKEIIKEKELLA